MSTEPVKRAAFYTLGCRVNQYETQAIREALKQEGFREVRGLRDRSGRDALLRQADLVTGNTDKASLARRLAELCETPLAAREREDLRRGIGRIRDYEPLSLSRSRNARAFVKIQDGCNSFCTYCYVPFVRGRERSRPAQDILEEVRRLAENGYREVVLTGIETGSYGGDLPGKPDLVSLVETIHDVPGIERIRFGSLKPTLFTDDFCARLAALPHVMPHFHLSLQSGSDAVLSAMGRQYDRAGEERAVEAILNRFPDAGLSADFICGFPGEREEDFLETVSLVEKIGLLHSHIFPYSPRKGTRAATLPDQIEPEEKKRRAEFLLVKAKESSLVFAGKRADGEYRVLCERIRDGFAYGYTENFLYTRTPVFPETRVGEIFSVRLGRRYSFSVETLTVDAKKTVDNSYKK